MAFLLGSLTSGLFGGLRDTMDIANTWETIKQRRLETKRQQDMMDAADKAKAAMDSDTSAKNTALPQAQPTITENTPFKEPDLSTLPTPAFMKKGAQAIYNPGGELSREHQAYGTKPASSRLAIPTSTGDALDREHQAYGTDTTQSALIPRVNPNDPLNLGGAIHAIGHGFGSMLDTIGRIATPDARPDNEPAPATPSAPATPATPSTPSTPSAPASTAAPAVQPRTDAPTYLPPQGPMSQALPTGRPSVAPSLASGQMGLGASILAALNPMTGRTA